MTHSSGEQAEHGQPLALDQFLLRGLQIVRSFLDELFKVIAVFRQGLFCLPALGDVAKNQNDAGDPSIVVFDGRTAVINGYLSAVLSYQYRMIR